MDRVTLTMGVTTTSPDGISGSDETSATVGVEGGELLLFVVTELERRRFQNFERGVGDAVPSVSRVHEFECFRFRAERPMTSRQWRKRCEGVETVFRRGGCGGC
jgi:hypothetical protein